MDTAADLHLDEQIRCAAARTRPAKLEMRLVEANGDFYVEASDGENILSVGPADKKTALEIMADAHQRIVRRTAN